ncbi:MAG: MBL fold metallo-hydrolase [Campylobacterota bacterium]|nr:MBL fold metallo-hydrolase [Campylobacterota bacterium]
MRCYNSKKAVFTFVLFLVVLWFGAEECYAEKKGEKMDSPIITVVFDNNPYKKGLETGWGFSCLIEGMEKTVLFDTGADGSVLLDNMEKLGIDPEIVEILVLSHAHSDHVGGVYSFLQKNNKVTVYVPESFPESFKDHTRQYGAHIIEVKESAEILNGLYSTGEMGPGLKEQSLIICTPKGMVIITGCAHPGIVNIVKRAKEMFDDEVLLVMGGFHMMGKSRSEVDTIISNMKKFGVRYVGPCHCTGDKARDLFQQAYREHFISLGVGKRIDSKELP